MVLEEKIVEGGLMTSLSSYWEWIQVAWPRYGTSLGKDLLCCIVLWKAIDKTFFKQWRHSNPFIRVVKLILSLKGLSFFAPFDGILFIFHGYPDCRTICKIY